MNRKQLEHLIRAAADIADDDEIIVIGSQSILGQFPSAPESLLRSMEADVFPRNIPERASVIDGTIGELSPFHETFGYYAQGVDETTAVLPEGWTARLVPVRGPGTRGATGWCLEVHDLMVSKLVAGRAKDLEFISQALQHQLIELDLVKERLEKTALSTELRAVADGRLARLAASRARPG